MRQQLRQTIYVATFSSRGSFGDPSFNAPASMLARVEPITQETDTPDAEKRQTRWVVITEAAIAISSRVWLPGDDQTNPKLGRTPFSIEPCYDEFGNLDHQETTV